MPLSTPTQASGKKVIAILLFVLMLEYLAPDAETPSSKKEDVTVPVVIDNKKVDPPKKEKVGPSRKKEEKEWEVLPPPKEIVKPIVPEKPKPKYRVIQVLETIKTESGTTIRVTERLEEIK